MKKFLLISALAFCATTAQAQTLEQMRAQLIARQQAQFQKQNQAYQWWAESVTRQQQRQQEAIKARAKQVMEETAAASLDAKNRTACEMTVRLNF